MRANTAMLVFLLLLLNMVAAQNTIYEWGETLGANLQSEPFAFAQFEQARSIVAWRTNTAVIDKNGDFYTWGELRSFTVPTFLQAPEKLETMWSDADEHVIVVAQNTGNMYTFSATFIDWNMTRLASFIGDQNRILQTLRNYYYHYHFVLVDNGDVYYMRATYVNSGTVLYKLNYTINGAKLDQNSTHMFVLDRSNQIHIFNIEGAPVRTAVITGESVERGSVISDFSTGYDHELVITNKGLFCRGGNRYGQCGMLRETNGVHIESFTRVTNLNFAKVVAGSRISFGLLADKRSIMSWGDDENGKLISFSLDVADFGSVRFTSPVESNDFAASFGIMHTVMRMGGQVYTFGRDTVRK